MKQRGDWMLWKDRKNRIHVRCSECGYELGPGEEIPDSCPRCKTRILNRDRFYTGRKEN